MRANEDCHAFWKAKKIIESFHKNITLKIWKVKRSTGVREAALVIYYDYDKVDYRRVSEGLSDLSTSFVKKFKSSPHFHRAQLRVWQLGTPLVAGTCLYTFKSVIFESVKVKSIKIKNLLKSVRMIQKIISTKIWKSHYSQNYTTL